MLVSKGRSTDETSLRYDGPVQRLGERPHLCKARGVSDESYRKDVGAFFRTLHDILNHLLVTDRIWMRRFTGEGEHPSTLNAIMFDELPSLEAARRAEDARIVQYVEALSEEEIGKDFSYSITKGVPPRLILRDLLAHWFNHQISIIAVRRAASHCSGSSGTQAT
jgi:uncharacterized damage-inducible protein DinB